MSTGWRAWSWADHYSLPGTGGGKDGFLAGLALFAAVGALNLQAWVQLILVAVLAALLILLVMVAVAGSLNPSRQDFVWFIRLRRPRWLVFESFIPVIWLLIYACFYISAWLTWQASWSGLWMAAFLVQLVLVQSYTLVICRSRSLGRGTAIGFAGWVWGIALTLSVASESSLAAALLLPYLLWSPVGTWVTWQMRQLNR